MSPVASIGHPPLENRAGYQRINPTAVAEFAAEFSALLRDVQSRQIGAANTQKLDALLDSFEDLVSEMRAASVDIKRLLDEHPV